jgi:hypothetical protein
MFSLDMNRHLWKDDDVFEKYLEFALHLNKAVFDNTSEPKVFQICSKMFDSVMEYYEPRHGTIEDPIFHWSDATANALFLLIGKSFDSLGPARISYVLNGYKESLSWHRNTQVFLECT